MDHFFKYHKQYQFDFMVEISNASSNGYSHIFQISQQETEKVIFSFIDIFHSVINIKLDKETLRIGES